ncbi:MAG: FUSC family membrane protein, partial [Burkholderiaceae bacterium]
MFTKRNFQRRTRGFTRAALSHYVLSGLSAAVGLFLISGGVRLTLGAFASAIAVIGVIVAIPPDQPAPRRGKLQQFLPSVIIGLPLFFGVQMLRDDPVDLGLLIVPASFLAFLGAAWGKRGIPVSISAMFAIIFSIAVPSHPAGGSNFTTTLYFALGMTSYVIYATLANAVLNARYRVQILADTLLSLGALMRTQAQQFVARDDVREPSEPIGRLIRDQAGLADQIQGARNILLESPRTKRRQQLAGMLIGMLEMRDHLLASDLDLDKLVANPGPADVLSTLRETLFALATEIERLADSFFAGRQPEGFASHRPRLAKLEWQLDAAPEPQSGQPTPAILARGLADRIGHIDDEALRLIALARGDAPPDLAVVRATWQMFVSQTSWSWRPFLSVWRWDAPSLRHAI